VIGREVAVWDKQAGPSWPVLRGDLEADVCVIGLGGTGLACIQEALATGCTVVGVDAVTVGGAAAGRNGGLLRAGLSSFHHDACRLLGRSRAARLYALTASERERLLRDLPGLARRCGYARVANDTGEVSDCRRHFEALRDDGFPVEWIDGPDWTGLRVPDDAAVDPLARCRAEADRCARAGARLFERSPVLRVDTGEVECADGRIRSRVAVVAVDGGLTALVPELSDRVRPARLQVLASRGAPDWLPMAGSTRSGWDYWQRLDDDAVLFGGCRDAGGEAEWTSDGSITSEVQDALDGRFEALMGGAQVATHRWAATVGYPGTGLPILEEVRPRVWAVGAYSGTGNLLGPVCGRAAVRLASGATTESPLE
jgi:glycine/D-amino acid oxidase-like deaminating enzyme